MIIDLRTRIWSSLEQFGPEVATHLRQRYAKRWEQLDGSPASHERAMSCVDAACVLGFRSELLSASIPNELVAEFVAKDPRHRIGVAGIDPMAHGAMHDLEQAIQLGLAGVTVSPAAQGFHPSHSAAMRIYERCAELRMPVIVAHDVPLTRSSILEFARPANFDEVARSFPELRIVIGEFGLINVAEAIALAGKHTNLFIDVSCYAGRPWELYNALLAASATDVMDKLLFGSGFPFDSPAHVIETLYSVNGYSHGTQLPSIPRSQIRSIVERDTLSAIGFDVDLGDAERRRSGGEALTEPAAAKLVRSRSEQTGEPAPEE